MNGSVDIKPVVVSVDVVGLLDKIFIVLNTTVVVDPVVVSVDVEWLVD